MKRLAAVSQALRVEETAARAEVLGAVARESEIAVLRRAAFLDPDVILAACFDPAATARLMQHPALSSN